MNSPAALISKLEELSLMLVMTTDGDETGYMLLAELVKDVIANASGEDHGPLIEAGKILTEWEGKPDYLGRVQTYVAEAQRFLDDSSTTFTSGSEDSETNKSDDVSKDVDPRFLAEFIETHNLLLQDFESNLLEAESSGGDPADLETSVKRYIHNLKGDAGSIGLRGIERSCHEVETMIADSSARDRTPMLLGFKEWVCECLTAFVEGTAPPRTAEEFLTAIRAEAPVAAPPAPVVHELAPQFTTKVNVSEVGERADKAYSLEGERDLLVEFANEVEEHLTNVESVLLNANGSFPRDAVDTIFRAVHSVKGGSAYFGLEEMTRCSHILENFLADVRDGKRQIDPILTSYLFVYVDIQKNVLLRAKKSSSGDGVMHYSNASSEFLESLETYAKGGVVQPVAAAPARPAEIKIPQPACDSPAPESTLSPSVAPPARQSEDAVEARSEKVAVKNFVKVDTMRLDQLIDSIGEMVIYSSMLIRHCRELLGHDEKVMDTTHRVEKFSRDLQDIGMSMRLVPIKGLFQKMSRLVWDTSKKLGKDVVFTMEGEDTELDRNLIDKLADPLMHMVRNALDHGIEQNEDRVKSGKPSQGHVTLSAFHAGGSIHIEIKDDGKGLNAEKLVAKAIEKGLLHEGQKLSDSDAFQLIFASGFSTAASVTDISGRGVGMDVVRRNVESLRGRIHIQSKVGEGSVFTIELPLTLAIIDGVQIQVGSEEFIVPSLSIVEFVKAKEQMLSTTFDRGETFHFRGSYIPIYRLADLYGIEPRFSTPLEATMVVVESGHELVALMVDEILGEVSTVIKGLGPLFEEGKGIAGCSIMPRGNVALILDVRSLLELARSSYSNHRPDNKELGQGASLTH